MQYRYKELINLRRASFYELSENIPCTVKNSNHLFHRSDNVNSANLLAIGNLFTSIDNKAGLDVVRTVWSNRSTNTHLLEDLEFCITYIFNERNFRQTNGTAEQPYTFCADCDIAIYRFEAIALPCRLQQTTAWNIVIPPNFLVSKFCGNFRRVLDDLPATVGKLCVSTKLLTRKSGEITVFYAMKILEMITI